MHLITDRPAEIDDVKLHILKERDGSTLSFIQRPFQTKKIVQTIKPDVLHAHFLLNYGFFGAYSGFHPFIITMWANEIDPRQEPTLENTFLKLGLTKMSIDYTLKKADLIQTLESYQKELCMEYGVPEERIVVLYNYVDETVFSPEKRSQKLRKDLGIGDGTAVICLRGFDPRYKVNTFVRAIPPVLREVPDAIFLLAGDAKSENDRNAMVNLSKELGIEKNLKFLGYIGFDLLPSYLASSDIHVDTTIRGAGIGHGNIQAMSCGLPRLAAGRKGIEETVRDGETGYVYGPEDHEELANRLIILLKDRNLRVDMGRRNRKFVEKINREGRTEIGIEKYYEDLISKCKK
jgi:glycosyltransferase involved in cell wall biosynthesis